MVEQGILDNVVYDVARDSTGRDPNHDQTLAVLRDWLNDHEALRRNRPLIIIRYRIALAQRASASPVPRKRIIKPRPGILDRVMARHFEMIRRYQPG